MRKPKLKVYRDNAGEFRWTLKATNGRTLSDSAEGYKRPDKVANGFEAVLRLLDGDLTAFELVNDTGCRKITLVKKAAVKAGRINYYRSNDKQYRWRLIAANGNIVADCSESFTKASEARINFKRVVAAVGGSQVNLLVEDET